MEPEPEPQRSVVVLLLDALHVDEEEQKRQPEHGDQPQDQILRDHVGLGPLVGHKVRGPAHSTHTRAQGAGLSVVHRVVYGPALLRPGVEAAHGTHQVAVPVTLTHVARELLAGLPAFHVTRRLAHPLSAHAVPAFPARSSVLLLDCRPGAVRADSVTHRLLPALQVLDVATDLTCVCHTAARRAALGSRQGAAGVGGNSAVFGAARGRSSKHPVALVTLLGTVHLAVATHEVHAVTWVAQVGGRHAGGAGTEEARVRLESQDDPHIPFGTRRKLEVVGRLAADLYGPHEVAAAGRFTRATQGAEVWVRPTVVV